MSKRRQHDDNDDDDYYLELCKELERPSKRAKEEEEEERPPIRKDNGNKPKKNPYIASLDAQTKRLMRVMQKAQTQEPHEGEEKKRTDGIFENRSVDHEDHVKSRISQLERDTGLTSGEIEEITRSITAAHNLSERAIPTINDVTLADIHINTPEINKKTKKKIDAELDSEFHNSTVKGIQGLDYSLEIWDAVTLFYEALKKKIAAGENDRINQILLLIFTLQCKNLMNRRCDEAKGVVSCVNKDLRLAAYKFCKTEEDWKDYKDMAAGVGFPLNAKSKRPFPKALCKWKGKKYIPCREFFKDDEKELKKYVDEEDEVSDGNDDD